MITIEVPVKPVRNLTMTSMVILDQNLLRLVEVEVDMTLIILTGCVLDILRRHFQQ
jgi:hypothetical protein